MLYHILHSGSVNLCFFRVIPNLIWSPVFSVVASKAKQSPYQLTLLSSPLPQHNQRTRDQPLSLIARSVPSKNIEIAQITL